MTIDSGAREPGNIRDKVRLILERANHPNTPQAEAETAIALAFRLMQKYNLNDADVKQREQVNSQSDEIEAIEHSIFGPYRVRRGSLFYVIAQAVSCACFRENRDVGTDEVRMVAFGTARDRHALEVLFQAAELLALRMMPPGDRRFRTSWWHGFNAGVGKKLTKERTTIFKESPGSELVLIERFERASSFMYAAEPGLSNTGSSFINNTDAYGAGHSAGMSFSTGSNSLGSWQRSLGSGSGSGSRG